MGIAIAAITLGLAANDVAVKREKVPSPKGGRSLGPTVAGAKGFEPLLRAPKTRVLAIGRCTTVSTEAELQRFLSVAKVTPLALHQSSTILGKGRADRVKQKDR